MVFTAGHIVGVVGILIIINAVSLYAGTKVKSAADFSGGSRKLGSAAVAGTIMGTLVGGSGTVGTAQLAFRYGFCAWWFGLGSAIGCLILAFGLTRRLYEHNVETVPQYLALTYGSKVGPIASVFTSVGMFLSIISQGLASVALLTAVLHMSNLGAVIVTVVLTLTYVAAGGVQAAGRAGVTKLILLYGATITCGVLAYVMAGGAHGLAASFPRYPWFSFFGRGVSKDMAGCFSLVVGVLSTQTYVQAVLSGKSMGVSRLGALFSAIFLAPLGLGGVLVGLYMRAHFPQTPSGNVLPIFVMKFLPPVFAGAVLATLLITVIGTTAGLTLGISTMMTRDIYQRVVKSASGAQSGLWVQRIMILIISLLSVYFITGNAGGLILGFGFASQGLRGCVVLFPLLGAMFFRRYVSPTAGVAAALLGPLANFAWFFAFPKGMDPLYPGLLASLLALIVFSLLSSKRAGGGSPASVGARSGQ